MIFAFGGDVQIFEKVTEFLKRENQLPYKFDFESVGGGFNLVVTFDKSFEEKLIPFFMNWLHFHSKILKRKFCRYNHHLYFYSRFESISI